ncbi:hypothetical protein [Flagellimonas sp.]|uniref:hypothetical protein n=1 Tax=Flagellimonas sp. TaxID=2058762 RepID=UPI003F4A7C30
MKSILFLLLLISYSGFGQDQLFGCYTSKKEENSMFVTKIELKDDWTFKYEFVGDLAYNWGGGSYDIDTEQVVILNFGESHLDSTQQIIQSLSSGKEIFGRRFYVLKKQNLYPLGKDGILNKKARLEKSSDCNFRNK